MSALPYAVRYARLGWHVLPLNFLTDAGCSCGKPDCGSPGKHPFSRLAPHGLKDATIDPATIAGWFRQHPQLNLGIRTGAVSGIVVVDLDWDHEGIESFADLEKRYGNHPPTVAVMTGGGGLHLYFRHPGGEVRNSASTLGPGVDVRGDGGFVVAPPSTHSSGTPYRWDGEGTPGRRDLAPMPPWVTARAIPPTSSRRYTPSTVTLPGRFAPIPEGQRNSGLASIAGKARRMGADEQQLDEIVRKANAEACHPPLPEREVEAIARSIARYEPGA